MPHSFLADDQRAKPMQLACLDDAPVQALADAPVRYSNGRDNDWGHEPGEAEKRWL